MKWGAVAPLPRGEQGCANGVKNDASGAGAGLKSRASVVPIFCELRRGRSPKLHVFDAKTFNILNSPNLF